MVYTIQCLVKKINDIFSYFLTILQHYCGTFIEGKKCSLLAIVETALRGDVHCPAGSQGRLKKGLLESFVVMNNISITSQNVVDTW